MATLELINITKKFGDLTAVENVNLRVEEGEFVTLLGPSGCGKSTILNMTAGLEEVTSGEIRINGKKVNELNGKSVFSNIIPPLNMGDRC